MLASISRANRSGAASRAPFAGAWLAAVWAGGLLAGGCASGGVEAYESTQMRKDMGRITQGTLEDGLEKMIRKYALQLVFDDVRGRDLYYETAWEIRPVLAEEEVVGVTNARNRIVIRGRRLENRIFRFSWFVDNEVTTVTTPEWHAARIPEEVVKDYERIYSDLSMEVRAGVRR